MGNKWTIILHVDHALPVDGFSHGPCNAYAAFPIHKIE
jgi:hypothetical protein